MGHDLPVGAWVRIVDLIAEHIASARFAARRGAIRLEETTNRGDS